MIKIISCLLLFIGGVALTDQTTFLQNSIANQNKFHDDPCYDSQTGIPQRCIPPFENVAFNKEVIASSQCGQSSPMSYCIQPPTLNRQLMQASALKNKFCSECDSKNPDKFQDTRFLTDLEQTNSTCWLSAPVYKPTEKTNITLQISFGKKYELTYISMQFCTMLKPDSLSIMKSMDYGKTWMPFQFYSSDCENMFNRPLKTKITQANEQEAVCTDQHLKSSPFNTNRIGFSTLEGRPSFHEFDTSPVLQDWVTATDIKIVFDRLLSPDMSTKVMRNQRRLNQVASRSSHRRESNSRMIRSQVKSQLDQLGYFFAAVSELAIGGRCKCNGHASRCILNREGKYQCDCKHNTAGLECERCLPFHYDRPWARATPRDANECIACNCNNHSNQCRFNHELYKLSATKRSGGICLNCQHNTMGRNCHYCKSGFYRNSLEPIQSQNACKACTCNSHSSMCRFNKELYLLSGRKSGGTCINCKHNTAGRHCHYCKDAYYRDQSYPITHQHACRKCNCHMIGSSGKVCNQSSGQCPCKEGVAGIRCDRCKAGYMQSNSPTTPCIKIIEATTTSTTTTTTTTTTSSTTAKNSFFDAYNPDHTYFNYASSDPAKVDDLSSNDYYYDDIDQNPCDYCTTKSQRVTFREFCKNDYAFAIRLIEKGEELGNNENLDTKIQGNNVYSKFTCDISRLFKSKTPDATRHNSTPRSTYYEIINKAQTKEEAFNLDSADKINLWIDNQDLACKCPELKINRKYLIMTRSYSLVQYLKSQASQSDGQVNTYAMTRTKLAGILLDRETFITEWRGQFIRRMRRFSRHFRNGKCARFNYN